MNKIIEQMITKLFYAEYNYTEIVEMIAGQFGIDVDEEQIKSVVM